MKTLGKLIKMEMLNIHFFKPSKNVAIKETVFLGAMFILMAVYGVVFMKQVGDSRIKELSILAIWLLAIIAAVYDCTIRMKSQLYDYNQYKMISYLPIGLLPVISAKFISLIVVAFRWMLIVGLPFSIVYATELQLSPVYLITMILLLLNGSLAIPILSILPLVLFQRSKLAGILTVAGEVIALGGLTKLLYMIDTDASGVDVLLNNPLWPTLMILFELLIIRGMIGYVSADYREVIGRIEWKEGSAKQVRAEVSSTNVLHALYSKEKKAFYSFKLYLLNTMAPIIIFSLLIVALCLVPEEMVKSVLAKSGYERELLTLIPIFLCFIFGMSSPTYCSLSLEGKAMDVLKSKPLQFRDLLIAKTGVYIKCIIPFVIADSILINYVVNRSFGVAAILVNILFSLIFVMVTGIIGILADVLLGNFEWVNQVNVVKQSITMPLQMLGCALLVGIPSGLVMGCTIEKNILYFMVTFIWGIIGVFLYVVTNKIAKKKFGI